MFKSSNLILTSLVSRRHLLLQTLICRLFISDIYYWKRVTGTRRLCSKSDGLRHGYKEDSWLLYETSENQRIVPVQLCKMFQRIEQSSFFSNVSIKDQKTVWLSGLFQIPDSWTNIWHSRYDDIYKQTNKLNLSCTVVVDGRIVYRIQGVPRKFCPSRNNVTMSLYVL